MEQLETTGTSCPKEQRNDFTLPNAQRIITARHAILAASWARGNNPAICDEAVIDLLADLMHFCAAQRIDFADCARIAALHFEAEIGGAS